MAGIILHNSPGNSPGSSPGGLPGSGPNRGGIELAVALGEIVRRYPTSRGIAGGGTVRGALAVVAEAGLSWVQLDATLPGIRPRELDRRARKDLLALIARSNCRVAGLDLFIPRRDFTDPARIDRAMSAALAAVELAADLGKVALSLGLPVKSMAEESRKTLVEAAEGRGVRLAVHAEDQLDDLLAWVASVDLRCLGVGLDPAALLALGSDPVACVHRVATARALVAARLDDFEALGPSESADLARAGERRALGEGDLDLTVYRLGLELAHLPFAVLDLRGVDPPIAMSKALRAWR